MSKAGTAQSVKSIKHETRRGMGSAVMMASPIPLVDEVPPLAPRAQRAQSRVFVGKASDAVRKSRHLLRSDHFVGAQWSGVHHRIRAGQRYPYDVLLQQIR